MNAAVPIDPTAPFMDAMRAFGFTVEDIEPDGQIHRARIEGDKAGARSGWYILHTDGIAAGAFGDWRTGESKTWRHRGGTHTPAERERLRAAWVEAKRQRDGERERGQRAAQARAQAMWHEAAPPVPNHAYLATKGVQAHGIRQRDDVLLVPMRDAMGELWAVQTIAPDGTKRFLRGARKRGLYHAIGGAVGDVLAICEGYATAATVHEATGYPVAVAFDAGNMEPVAKALRAKYPGARIIVCADDDKGTEERTGRNPGRYYAEQAARAVGAAIALPEFTP